MVVGMVWGLAEGDMLMVYSPEEYEDILLVDEERIDFEYILFRDSEELEEAKVYAAFIK